MYEDGTPVDTDKALKALAKSSRHLNECNMRLSMLLLAYLLGSSYDADVATALSKMGRGNEGLQEMWNRKMKGGL